MSQSDRHTRRSFLLQSGTLMGTACCGTHKVFSEDRYLLTDEMNTGLEEFLIESAEVQPVSFPPCLTVMPEVSRALNSAMLSGTLGPSDSDLIERATRYTRPDPTIFQPNRVLTTQEQQNVLEGEQLEFALAAKLLWLNKKGGTLKVSLLGSPPGGTVINQAIDSAIEQWGEHVPFQIQRVDTGGDIRISFHSGGEAGGDKSYLGTDALSIDPGSSTMNLDPSHTHHREDLRVSTGVALHEFGHALGAIHEHQHPDANFAWNIPYIYQYYAERYGWDVDKVNRNVIKPFSRDSVWGDTYESTSIMHYYFPPQLIRNSSGYVGTQNTELTLTDKNTMRGAYGMSPVDGTDPNEPTDTTARGRLKAADAVPLLKGTPVTKGFADSGDYHLYKITPDSSGQVVVNTIESQPMEITLELFDSEPFSKNGHQAISKIGPGRNLLNAFLEHQVNAGTTYYVLVRPSFHRGSRREYTLEYRNHLGVNERNGFQQTVSEIETLQQQATTQSGVLQDNHRRNSELIRMLNERLGN